jgi:hypothetical protein
MLQNKKLWPEDVQCGMQSRQVQEVGVKHQRPFQAQAEHQNNSGCGKRLIKNKKTLSQVR